jgi:hypothetical protein
MVSAAARAVSLASCRQRRVRFRWHGVSSGGLIPEPTHLVACGSGSPGERASTRVPAEATTPCHVGDGRVLMTRGCQLRHTPLRRAHPGRGIARVRCRGPAENTCSSTCGRIRLIALAPAAPSAVLSPAERPPQPCRTTAPYWTTAPCRTTAPDHAARSPTLRGTTAPCRTTAPDHAARSPHAARGRRARRAAALRSNLSPGLEI